MIAIPRRLSLLFFWLVLMNCENALLSRHLCFNVFFSSLFSVLAWISISILTAIKATINFFFYCQLSVESRRNAIDEFSVLNFHKKLSILKAYARLQTYSSEFRSFFLFRCGKDKDKVLRVLCWFSCFFWLCFLIALLHLCASSCFTSDVPDWGRGSGVWVDSGLVVSSWYSLAMLSACYHRKLYFKWMVLFV